MKFLVLWEINSASLRSELAAQIKAMPRHAEKLEKSGNLLLGPRKKQ